MGITKRIQDSVLSTGLSRALRSMSKESMLRLIDLICRANPDWRDNVAAATELIEREHPFFQWVMAMRRDLHPQEVGVRGGARGAAAF